MANRITVLHYAFGDNGKQVAIVIPTSEDMTAGLNEAYRLTNSTDTAWFEPTASNVRVHPCAKNGCRSTSVGDVLVYRVGEGMDAKYHTFQVASVGFKRLSNDEFSLLTYGEVI